MTSEADETPGVQKPGFMDNGPRLAAIVVFVRDLDQSAGFYSDLLKMEIVARETTALVLAGSGNSAVVLRAIGPRGEHSLGAVGVQYAYWVAHDPQELRRCEEYLQERSAHVETNTVEGRTVVEGRDPDGLPVMVMYPAPDRTTMDKIMIRIYAW
jgi:catechol 2,3-dioxygenase-like lactoylglutathione lyase family enzyme